LTHALKVRPERVGGEVLLPQTWSKEVDRKGEVGIDALEHIDEIDIRIDAL
jgi:hypothetical protein